MGRFMFAGIVEGVGSVEVGSIPERFAVRSELFVRCQSELKIGDSIAVNGVCLTLVELGERAIFDLATETRRRTTLGGLRPGAEVNLELSLRFGDRVDGHFVQGHVDGVSEVLSCSDEGNNTQRVELTLPEEVRGLIVPKGAVALDGVSLTVGEVDPEKFCVYLIPHTKARTNFRDLQPGRLLNVEADAVARYVRGVLEGFGLKERGVA